MEVIYVSSKGDAKAQLEDPVLKQLQPSGCSSILAGPEIPLENIVGDICESARKAVEQSDSCVVIIEAFLDPDNEGVRQGDIWDPPVDKIQELFKRRLSSGLRASTCLKSLNIMWSIWERIPGKVKIFVTTDGIPLTSRAKRALDISFSAGKACRVYNWDCSNAWLSDLRTISKL